MTIYVKDVSKNFNFQTGDDYFFAPDTYFSTLGDLNIVSFPMLKIVVGGDNPSHKSLIRARVNALNALDASLEDVKLKLSSFDYTTYTYDGNPDGPQLLNSHRYYGSGALITPPNVGDATLDESALDQAKARFISKCRDKMSPAQAGVIIGEIRETLHGIRNPAQALRDSISSYLKDVKRASRGLKKASNKKKNHFVSSTWLEYTFGWLPLLSDIDASMEALAGLVTGVKPLTYVRGFGSASDPPVSDFFYSFNHGFIPVHVEWTVKYTTKCYIYGQIREDIDPYPTFIGSFGLRPHDVVTTIWELIPYSFVVDYFTNIGDIISAASFYTSYLAWYGQTVTTEALGETHAAYWDRPDYNLPDNLFKGAVYPGSASRMRKHIARSIPSSLVPSLRLKIPGIKQGFNIGALIAQASSIRI